MNYPHPPDIRAYLEFISDTGCRVGELCNLHPEDFEYTQEGYIVRLDGKTGERWVPVSEMVYDNIIKYIPIKFKVDWLSRRLSEAFRNSLVKGTAHSLRHTFCTQWDGSESALQKITGHTNIQTLGIYRQLRMDQVSKEHKQHSLLRILDESNRQTGLK